MVTFTTKTLSTLLTQRNNMNLEQIIKKQKESYRQGKFATVAPDDWNDDNIEGYNCFKKEFWNWHSSSIKEILEARDKQLVEAIKKEIQQSINSAGGLGGLRHLEEIIDKACLEALRKTPSIT